MGRLKTELTRFELESRDAAAANTREAPPDPDCMNFERSLWAKDALATFANITGSDFGDCVCDLLADLMHFADRHGIDFDAELKRARRHYRAETMPDAA